MNETVTDIEYSVGQKMILIRFLSDPIVVEIERLTKTQILTKHPEHPADPKRSMRFEKISWRNPHDSIHLKGHYVVGGRDTRWYSKIELYDYSVEALAELQKLRGNEICRREEEIQAKQKRRQKITDRKAQELAEVKEACHDGQLALSTKLSITQPDGTRIYILDVPVRSSCFEGKKGWETAMVVCKHAEEVDWEKWNKWKRSQGDVEITEAEEESGRQACLVQQVKFYHTSVNSRSCSFSSISPGKATNDHEALWEVLRDVYTSQ